MSTLQLQIMESLNGLSDESLKFILDMIQKYVAPADLQKQSKEGMKRFFSLERKVEIDSDAVLNFRENSLNTALANEIMKCIVENFGVVEAEAFIAYIQSEPMNYTKWQNKEFASVSLDDFGDAAVEWGKAHPHTC